MSGDAFQIAELPRVDGPRLGEAGEARRDGVCGLVDLALTPGFILVPDPKAPQPSTVRARRPAVEERS